MMSVRYLAGESFVGRRDPRVLILVPMFTVLSVAQIRDVRIMGVALVLAMTYYLAAGIPLAEVWTNWLIVVVFIVCLAGINGLIVGAEQYGHDTTVLFTLPLLGAPVSTASLSYALTLVGRYAAIAATGVPLAFAVRPGDLAVAFARLGVPDRFAYAVDLTFRLLPQFSTTVRETIAAQRLRGYEPRRTYNPVLRIRRLQPLMIPVAVNVFIDAEDVADALDLRCFGPQRRTWLRSLHFDMADIFTISVPMIVALTATIVTTCGWMPPLWPG
jgi:energy-coupling factor transport system permease protein